MNFLFDNLTSKENINIFSTPRFRQILFDKNKNVKLPSTYGTLSQDLIFQKDSNINEKNNISKDKSKEQIYFKDKDNFSLSSLTMMSGNTEKNQISINNINDSNTNIIKTKEKEDKNENGLFSFCDKIENYSFNNDINSKEKENNSKNKSEIKSEINKNLFNENSNNTNENISNNSNIKKDKNYKESQMMSGNSNQNSSSFQYNLPLENDKTPAIKDFFAFQDINIDEKDNKTIEEKSLSLDINKDIKKNKSIKMINKKSNLLYQYKANNTTNSSVRKVRKSQTQKFYSSHNKSISLVKKINYINNDSDYNPINKSAITRNSKNKNKSKNLVIKKNILHSYDNYNNKVKKKIKMPPKDEVADKDKDKKIFSSGKGNSKMVSPKKKLEIIIKHTEICMNNNILNRISDGSYWPNNIKQMNSNSSFEPKNRNSVQSELDYELYKNKKLKNNFSIKEHNYNKNNTIMYTIGNSNTNANDKSECSNSTNKVKNKSRKFIKSSTLDFCNNAVFNFNKFKNRGESNNINKITKNITNKNVNMSNKSNSNISKNIKKENKDKKIMDNKKYSYHTRNITNLHSNKIFNGMKGIFNNNDMIFKTINYEASDMKKKINIKNILESQIKTKTKIKIKKISPLPKFNSKNTNLNSKKENNHLYFRNSNIISNPNSNRTTNNFNGRYNNTVVNRDKNSKDKKQLNMQKKIKPNNFVKSKISTFNEIKNFLLNKTKNIIKLENKNQSTNKLTNNKINIPNTERFINENYSSVNLDSKSISDSVFINVNDSTNSLQNVGDSRINKIKVNTINMHKRIIKELSSKNDNKNSSFWKIHKKSKNSCLLNTYNNKDIKKLEYINNTTNGNSHISNNVTSLGSSYEKHIKVNSQIINFNKNKAKKNHEYKLPNDLVHHSILANNSKSVITDYSYTERNNNSISENLNVEKIKEEIRNNQNICKLYQSKRNVYLSNLNDNNSIEMPMYDIINNTTITNSNDYNNSNDGKITSYNRDEIIKYSILRNNQNNQIINEFSVILGEEKKNDKKISNNRSKNDKIEKANISSDGKRTIINVNQYYPSYYINTNNAHEILKTNNDIKK